MSLVRSHLNSILQHPHKSLLRPRFCTMTIEVWKVRPFPVTRYDATSVVISSKKHSFLSLEHPLLTKELNVCKNLK